MIYAVLTLTLIIASLLPNWWVRYVMHTYGKPVDQMPGTGSELARHLIKRFGLEGVSVEQTEKLNDHYDPNDKCIRLSDNNYNGKSITAIAIATHEVGHAIQFYRQEKISQLRGRYLPLSIILGKIGTYFLISMPIVAIFTKSPFVLPLFVALGLLCQLAGAFMYLIVLPEEWDASFNKALPILIEGEYLSNIEINGARQVLRAAAFTYFAAALARAVNIGRWFMMLRR